MSIRALMPASKQFTRNLADQARLALVVIDGPEYHLRAHFNPSEVQFERGVDWAEQNHRGKQPSLHYSGTKVRSMSLDLFLDCFELKGETLEEELDTLQRMLVAPDPSARDDAKRRPPVIELVNGPITGFRCVIESIAVKVTAFNNAMKPIRATVSLKLKEVEGHEGEQRDPVSLPRMNYLAWTKAEVDAKAGEARREQDWRARPKATTTK